MSQHSSGRYELRVAGSPSTSGATPSASSRSSGLWDEMKTHEVHMTDDLYFVDADGNKVAGFPHAAIKDGPEDLEIERIALHADPSAGSPPEGPTSASPRPSRASTTAVTTSTSC